MDSYDFDVRLTPAARELLRPGEALVLDWHRMAICCAGVGEASLYAAGEKGLSRRKGLIRLKGEDPIYAARAIFPHLAGHAYLKSLIVVISADFALGQIYLLLLETERFPILKVNTLDLAGTNDRLEDARSLPLV